MPRCGAMGWQRLVGSLKLQVSFAKKPYQKDYILQKRPTILRELFNATATVWCCGVATISRLLEITGHFCRIWPLLQGSFAKETYNFNGSHPIVEILESQVAMGWLRLVGSLKLQVSFAEYPLFYRALLQKRLIILRRLLLVATHIHGTLAQRER